MTGFVFLNSSITVDDNGSHGYQRCLLLGRKAMTNLDNTFKSKDITADQGPSSKSCVFSNNNVEV